jgi:hypothetical protein
MVNPINIKPTLSQWLKFYKKWITSNPNLISDIESILKHLSYFIPGKVNFQLY